MRRISRVAVLPALLLALVLGGSLAAAAPPQPGDFRGLGFDQCSTPSQQTMDRWLAYSPYQAIGVYISGRQRACLNQPNLTPAWVDTQTRRGWRILPITLDHQPYCIARFPRYGQPDISADPTNTWYKARLQGIQVAEDAVASAKALGLPAGTTLWLDIEGFDYTNVRCRTSAMAFQHGWDRRLRTLGYEPGIYSSASSGIKMLDQERRTPSSYHWALPSRIWIARWDGMANVTTTYIPNDGWMPGDRMKQFRGGHDETWGGARVNIDSDFLQLGNAFRIPAEGPLCGGVPVSYPAYKTLTWGGANDPAQVKALQCLLTLKGWYAGPISGSYDQATLTAANRFQVAAHRPAYKTWRPQDWTALFSAGQAPTLKWGSVDPNVRKVQRALNAALGQGLPVTGVFDQATRQAVQAYQVRRNQRCGCNLPTTGNVTAAVWYQLQRGGI